jgi:hypothetical protein
MRTGKGNEMKNEEWKGKKDEEKGVVKDEDEQYKGNWMNGERRGKKDRKGTKSELWKGKQNEE